MRVCGITILEIIKAKEPDPGTGSWLCTNRQAEVFNARCAFERICWPATLHPSSHEEQEEPLDEPCRTHIRAWQIICLEVELGNS